MSETTLWETMEDITQRVGALQMKKVGLIRQLREAQRQAARDSGGNPRGWEEVLVPIEAEIGQVDAALKVENMRFETAKLRATAGFLGRLFQQTTAQEDAKGDS